jgi:hypothetical protein
VPATGRNFSGILNLEEEGSDEEKRVMHNYDHVTYYGKYFLTKCFSQEKIEVEVKTNLDKTKAFSDTIYFGPPSHNGMKFKYKPHSKANLKKMKWRLQVQSNPVHKSEETPCLFQDVRKTLFPVC